MSPLLRLHVILLLLLHSVRSLNWELKIVSTNLEKVVGNYFRIGRVAWISFEDTSRIFKSTVNLPETTHDIRLQWVKKDYHLLSKIITITNLETNEVYNCDYIQNGTEMYHDCTPVKRFNWKLELGSLQPLSNNVIQTEINKEQPMRNPWLRLNHYAFSINRYFAYFGRNISETITAIEINPYKQGLNLSNIILWNVSTGVEYGCAKIEVNSDKNSSLCKLFKSSHWKLKLITFEITSHAFKAEIIQDTFSIFSKGLSMESLCKYGNGYINYFDVKTYEPDAITGIKLHWVDKPINLLKMSLENEHTEHVIKLINGSGNSDHLYVPYKLPETKKELTKMVCPTNKTEIPNAVYGAIVTLVLITLLNCVICFMSYRQRRKSGDGVHQGWSKPSETERYNIITENTIDICHRPSVISEDCIYSTVENNSFPKNECLPTSATEFDGENYENTLEEHTHISSDDAEADGLPVTNITAQSDNAMDDIAALYAVPIKKKYR